MSSLLPAVPAGGLPDHTDLILCSVFIPLFAFSALVLFNTVVRVYGKAMIWGFLCFAFCMARLVALSLRLATTNNPTVGLLIAANVFLAAGTVVLYLVNIQIARRSFGQLHPQYGISLQWIANGACAMIIPLFIMSITSIVIPLTSTDPSAIASVRTVRLVASCFLTVIAALPIPLVTVALVLRPSPQLHEKPSVAVDSAESGETSQPAKRAGEPNTGYGPTPRLDRIHYNASFILIPAVLLTLEQAIRTTQAFYVPSVSADGALVIPWYMSKLSFWIFIFGLEWVVIVILASAIIPRRFSNLPARGRS